MKKTVPRGERKIRSFDVQLTSTGDAGTYNATIKPIDSPLEALGASGFRLADAVLDLVGELISDLVRREGSADDDEAQKV